MTAPTDPMSHNDFVPSTELEGMSFNGYLIHEQIGLGGMAVVYRATQVALNRPVAIKVLRPEFIERNPTFIERFHEEAKVIAGLSHPYILPIYDYGHAEQQAYIAMQFIPDGQTLRTYRPTNPEIPTWLQVVEVGRQLADALAHAHHHHIIHCDLKPSNILWHEGRPLLADFGLAVLEHERQQPGGQGLMGTPAYMAPEQFSRQPLDARTDIYGLGLILYQLVTGILPHTADSIEQIAINRTTLPTPPSLLNPALPATIDDLLLNALAIEPANRYRSMAEFRNVMDEISKTTPSTTPITKGYGLNPLEEDTTLVSPPELTPFQAPLPTPHFVNHLEYRNQIHEAVSTGLDKRIFGFVGLGGTGKTALATQVVHEVREYFPDGVLWAQMDATTPSAVLLSFGDSFGQWERIAEAPDLVTKASAARQILANKRVLVVLDNAEESDQLEYLLPTGPHCASLITTRNRKLLSSVRAEIIEVSSLEQADSVALLTNIIGEERVLAEIESAHEIIDLVGGLPLALEIVTGYLNEAEDLLLSEYKSALVDERQRLESLADWENANKDVVASFELSYNKLPAHLQNVFAGLSIFSGRDFSADAVSQIFQMPLAIAKSALGRMKSLSLLTNVEFQELAESSSSPEGTKTLRYHLHPLLKLYAHSKLSEDEDELKLRLLEYYVQLIQAQKQNDYLSLAQEWENIQGILQWAAHNDCWEPFFLGLLGLTEPAVGIVGFLDARGYWTDAIEMLDTALAHIDANAHPLWHLKFRIRLGVYNLRQGEVERSKECFGAAQSLVDAFVNDPNLPREQTIDIIRNSAYLYESMARISRRSHREDALTWITQGIELVAAANEVSLMPELGYLHIQQASILGHFGQIEQANEAAIRGIEMLPIAPSAAKVGGLINLANIASLRGNAHECVAYIEDGIQLAETIGDFRRLALLWMNLGAEQEQLGQYKQAKNSYDKALHLYQKMGHEDEGYLHSNLGLTYTILGQTERAHSHLHNAIELAQQIGMDELTCYAKTNLARLQISENEPQQAMDNLAAAKQVAEELQLSYQFIEIFRLQAEACGQLDSLEDGLSIIEQSIQQAKDMNHDLGEGASWRVKGMLLQETGASEDAKTAYKTSLALIDQLDPYECARTQLAMAQLQLQEGPTSAQQVNTLLNEALETFEALGTQREILETDALLNSLAF